jgi:LysM repeat protein
MPGVAPQTSVVRVQRGDTLSALAARVNGATTAGLAQLNGLPDANRIREGQLLLVPSHGTELEVTVRRGDTLGSLARRFRTSVKALCTANQTRSERPLKVGERLRVPVSPPQHDTPPTPTKPNPSWRPQVGRFSTALEQPGLQSVPISPSVSRAVVQEAVGAEAAFASTSTSPIGRAAVLASAPRFEHPIVGRSSNPTRTEPGSAATPPAQQLNLGLALRYASAANSTLENLTRLASRQVAAIGLVGAVVATARLPGETATFLDDLHKRRPADAFESGSKVARNVVRAVRGLEVLACALGSRSPFAHHPRSERRGRRPG